MFITTFLPAILFVIIAVYFCALQPVNALSRWIITGLLALFLSGLGIYLIANAFTDAGIDESVIYHLKIGLNGAAIWDFPKLIMAGVAYVIISGLFLVSVFDLLGKRKFKLTRAIAARIQGPRKFAPIMAISALLIAMALNPFTHNILALQDTANLSAETLTGDEFVKPASSKLSRKKNIVFIYMEGVERTFIDPELFPDLAPNLNRLAANNLNFDNIRQVYSTNYTMAGLVSSQCGVPLYAPNNINTMQRYDKFLPNAYCIGDILKGNGYNLSFLGGAKLVFAGKGKFFQSHGFDKVTGRAAHKKAVLDPESFNPWGLHDDVLLQKAYEDFLEQSQEDVPFGLFLLTVDTHIPDGFESQACESTQVKYGNGSEKMLNAVKCTDILIAEFVEKIRNSPAGKDTIIVIASDHLMMKNSITSQLKSVPRRNYFVIIDGKKSKPQTITKPGSALDMAPTLLSLLGIKSDGLGFGRNLLSNAETLIEQRAEDYDPYLKAMSTEMISRLWDYPSLDNGFIIDTKKVKLYINEETQADRWMDLPILLEFNADKSIKSVQFDHAHSRKLRNYMGRHVPASVSYLWIDYCDSINRKLTDPDLPVPDVTRWCAAYRPNENDSEIVTTVLDTRTLTLNDLAVLE